MFMHAALRRCNSRVVRLEPLERRIVLSSEPCLFDVPEQGAATRAVESINCFAADLYSQLQQAEGNLFYSPLSVSAALAMTYAGAAGQTATEMEDVLRFGNQPGIHESFAGLLTSLADRTALGDGFTLELANAIWPDLDLPVRDEFRENIRSNYDGEVQNLDYSDTELARQTINAWVGDQTRGRVQNLLDRLDPATVMVLTNSIYFQANWTDPFDPSLTGALANSFHLENGESVESPLMYSQIVLPELTFLDGFRVLEIPLEWGRSSMVLAMPADPAATPNELTPQLLAKIDDWLESPRGSQLTEVYLPRFTTTVGTQLEDLLADMGMPTAFGGGADFSNMTQGGGLWVDQVRHKAFLQMNEAGTEAAAATAVPMVICFAAGTPVLTPDGEKPIEQIKTGDFVVSKSEHDVSGKIERKQVEAVFRGHAELFRLQAGGQTIHATKEHRFFVQEKGWKALGDLHAGELLATDERAWISVENVATTGKLADVYNIRVADHRTYFVGGKAWQFALWTHNDYIPCFRGDRPFHFFIRDNVSTAILFMGRVDDPTQSANDLEPDFLPELRSTIEGTVYLDANRDRVRDPSESGLENWTVYIDANRNGLLEATEPQATTGLDGAFTLSPSSFSGQVVVAVAREDPRIPAPSREVILTVSQSATGIDLASFTDVPPTLRQALEIGGTAGDDSVLLRRSGDNLEVFLDDPLSSQPAISVPVESVSSIKLGLLAGDDQVIVDYTGGHPLPLDGLHLQAGGGNNTLRTVGDARGGIHVSSGNFEIPTDPGSISLFVEQEATVRLESSAHLDVVRIADNGRLFAARPGRLLRAYSIHVGQRASIHLGGGPLIVDGNANANAALLRRYIYNGQLRDETNPVLTSFANTQGEFGPSLIDSIAGEDVFSYSAIVAGAGGIRPAGDFSGDGVVDQADLDLVLRGWGEDAESGLLGWTNGLARGFVDQEELDAVLLNWGKTVELLPA